MKKTEIQEAKSVLTHNELWNFAPEWAKPMEEPLAEMWGLPEPPFVSHTHQAGQVCEHSTWAQQGQGMGGAVWTHSKLKALEL